MTSMPPTLPLQPERAPESVKIELTDWWIEYLFNERQTLIMRLGSVEDVLIRAGKLEARSITPRRKR
jgi:hypothetical protein